MANQFYTATGAPVAQARGASSSMRAEFVSVQSAFDKLPAPATLVTNNATLGIDTGSANAYIVAISALVTAMTDGMEVVFKAGNSTSGASTINVNGLGVKVVTRPDGSVVGAMDIVAGQYISMRYSLAAGSFQITSGISAVNTAAAATAAATLAVSAIFSTANTFTQPQSGPTPALSDSTTKYANMAALQAQFAYFLTTANVFTGVQSGPTPVLGDSTTKLATMAALQAAAALLAKLTGAAFSGDVVITVDGQGSPSTAGLHIQTSNTTAGNAILAMTTSGDADVQITKVRGAAGISVTDGSGTLAPVSVSAATLGGHAVNFSQAFGMGQAWQNVAASRASGTTYTNSTGKPIFISVSETGDGVKNLTISGILVGYSSSTGNDYPITGIVPSGANYVFTGNFGYWTELR